MGEIDEGALAELVADDADHALALLADMTGATDPALAALARRIAGRLVLDLARVGPTRARGVGRMRTSPADRAEGDLDMDAGLDALVTARAAGTAVDLADLRVRHWTRPGTALCLLVDRSGSMSGRRLATAAVAAASCAWRAPADWSVLAFADRQIAVKSQDAVRPAESVVTDLLRLRGQGTTDLDAALVAAARQLERSRATRRVTILLSDCRATAGADPTGAARRLEELCVIAPADDGVDAEAFAASVGARFATIDGPTALPAALAAVL